MLINERRAAAVLDEAGLDGLVGTRMENVFYLSGVYNISQSMFPFDQQCYAIVTREQLTAPTVVISTGDWDQSTVAFEGLRGTIHYGTFYRELAPESELNAVERHLKAQTIDRAPRKDALEALVAALEEIGLADKRVGIDEKAFNPAFRPELERRLPQLKIVPAAEVRAAGLACLELGALTSADFARAEKALEAAGLAGRLSQRRAEQTAGWWVFIPSQGSRLGALKKAAELKALGIEDYYIMGEDAEAPFALSLGVFRSEQAALARLAALRDLQSVAA